MDNQYIEHILIEKALEVLGIFPYNTPKEKYQEYKETIRQNNQRVQDSLNVDIDSNKDHRRKYHNLFNNIMPFVASDNPHHMENNILLKENGHTVHPLTKFLNMELYRHPDDLETPFISGIHSRTQRSDIWPYTSTKHYVSIEHHVANFDGKAAPLGRWTEVVCIKTDSTNEALLIAGYRIGEKTWDDKWKTSKTAVPYLIDRARTARIAFPTIYKKKQKMLSQVVTTKGCNIDAVNEHLDLSYFWLDFDITDPRATDIRTENGQVSITIMHTFYETIDRNTTGYQYPETFIV